MFENNSPQGEEKRLTAPRTEFVDLQRPKKSRFAGDKKRAVGGTIAVALAVVGFVVSSWLLEGDGWIQLLSYLVTVIVMSLALSLFGKYFFGPRFDLTFWASLVWVALVILAAILAPWLPLGEHRDSSATLLEPVMARPDLLSRNPLGTNNLGLDLLSRVIFGARVSLVVALVSVGIGIVVGGTLGILAGFFRKATDKVIGIFTNSLLAVPPLILLIALASVLKPNIMNLSFALSLMALPSMIRIARANTLAFAQREFVLAARSMGASNIRLMFRELLPNVFIPLASYGMLMVSILIVAEASLSFLGLGTPPPTPTWGNMIAEGEGRMFQLNPHVVLVPGAVLFLTVFSFNLLGEKARTHFDTRSAKV